MEMCVREVACGDEGGGCGGAVAAAAGLERRHAQLDRPDTLALMTRTQSDVGLFFDDGCIDDNRKHGDAEEK